MDHEARRDSAATSLSNSQVDRVSSDSNFRNNLARVSAGANEGDSTMACLARYFVKDQPLHIIQRGNNRGLIFASLIV
jgi:hypothetical protein